jgi:hypothetical protein
MTREGACYVASGFDTGYGLMGFPPHRYDLNPCAIGFVAAFGLMCLGFAIFGLCAAIYKIMGF